VVVVLTQRVLELLLALAVPPLASPQHLLLPCWLLLQPPPHSQRQPAKPDCSKVEAGTPLWHTHL
jgi:hypothetical protein